MATTRTASIGSIVTSRQRELALLGFVLVALFTLVSMVGWSESDPTVLRPGSGTVDNPCGVVGANLADLVFAFVGLGGWALIVLVPVAILGIAGRRVMSLLQWLLVCALFGVVLGALHLALRPWDPHGAGGLVGAGLGELLEAAVGGIGAWLVLGSVALLLVTGVARIRWSRLAGRIVGAGERLAPVLADGAGRARTSVVAFVAASAVGLGRLVVAGARSVGRALSGAGARVVASVRRASSDGLVQDEEPIDDDPESWEESVFSDVSGLDGPDDTVVAHGRALVQAEWEPTVGTRGAGDVLDLFPEFSPRTPASTGDSTPVAAEPRAVRPAREPTATAPSQAAAVHRAPPDPSAPVGEPTGRSIAPVRQGSGSAVAPSAAPPATSSAAPSASPPPAGPVVAPPSGVAAVAGPGVAVHRNDLLERRSRDDGRALREPTTFQLPRLSLLDEVPEQRSGYDEHELKQLATTLEEKLLSFGVRGQVAGVRPGPVVTIFEFLPDPGVKVSRISGLSDDLAMALKALRVRIVAPIPGRGVVGIEIPSKRRMTVHLRDVLASSEFRDTKAILPCVLGKDVEGRPVVADLARMPHLLIGGTTGSGKSVGVNGMLMSMLFTRAPDELRMLLVDPKMLEFELYADIPHLLHPVVTDPKIATQALAWACREMDDRYTLLARWGTRNIVSYNKKVEKELASWTRQKAIQYAPRGWSEDDDVPPPPQKLPFIVIVVDELADLMMVAGKEVEESICRIAQKARACGIHLIVATQRPSVDVVTGLIKANLPTRIAFQLRSRHDSRTVLDEIGAENLLGKGDMLYMPPGVGGLQRCHGAFVSDEEVARVTGFLREQAEPDFIEDLDDSGGADGGFDLDEEQDELYDDAVQIVIQSGKASTSMVQRHLKIGYNRAACIIDMMEANGVVGPADGSRPREVLVGGA